MKKTKNINFWAGIFAAFWFLFSTIQAHCQTGIYRVVAIGDSHVEPRSAFIRSLQNNLGSSYLVEGHGRRGWTSARWISASEDFRREVSSADIVLISLGGNDMRVGISPQRTEENIQYLLTLTSPTTLLVYHMNIPRLVLERRYLGSDGIHMTLTGARVYSEEISTFLFYP